MILLIQYLLRLEIKKTTQLTLTSEHPSKYLHFADNTFSLYLLYYNKKKNTHTSWNKHLLGEELRVFVCNYAVRFAGEE